MNDKTPEERITQLEQRLTALETHVSWLDIFQEGQVKRMIRDDTALEKTAPKSAGAESEPVWRGQVFGKDAIGLIPPEKIGVPYVYFTWENDTVLLWPDDRGCVPLSVEELQELVGAALAVLAAMGGGEQ